MSLAEALAAVHRAHEGGFFDDVWASLDVVSVNGQPRDEYRDACLDRIVALFGWEFEGARDAAETVFALSQASGKWLGQPR